MSRKTQEKLAFCTWRALLLEIEMVPIQTIQETYQQTLQSAAKIASDIDRLSLGRKQRLESAALRGALR